MAVKRIFVAAGHGGKDPGAVSGKNIEREIAIHVVDTAFKLLSGQDKAGRQVVKVPHAKNLVEEVAYINANCNAAYDLAINVHLNSNAGTPGTGTETWYGHKELAQEVNDELVKTLGLKNRGIKRNNNFYFNGMVRCASCIVELGFINNSHDVGVVVNSGGLALAKAIVKTAGGKWQDKKEPLSHQVKVPTFVESFKFKSWLDRYKAVYEATIKKIGGGK
jgi:N-acetylmuramoyl-L-alanine amidase